MNVDGSQKPVVLKDIVAHRTDAAPIAIAERAAVGISQKEHFSRLKKEVGFNVL